MVGGTMGLAIFLSVLNAKIIEYFVTPLFEAQGWDKRLILYVSLVTGLLIGLATGVDLITPLAAQAGQKVTYPAGIIITGILIGGGANLIYDIFDTIGAARERHEAEAERIRRTGG